MEIKLPTNNIVNQQQQQQIIIQPQINHTTHMQQPIVVNQNYQLTQPNYIQQTTTTFTNQVR